MQASQAISLLFVPAQVLCIIKRLILPVFALKPHTPLLMICQMSGAVTAPPYTPLPPLPPRRAPRAAELCGSLVLNSQLAAMCAQMRIIFFCSMHQHCKQHKKLTTRADRSAGCACAVYQGSRALQAIIVHNDYTLTEGNSRAWHRGSTHSSQLSEPHHQDPLTSAAVLLSLSKQASALKQLHLPKAMLIRMHNVSKCNNAYGRSMPGRRCTRQVHMPNGQVMAFPVCRQRPARDQGRSRSSRGRACSSNEMSFGIASGTCRPLVQPIPPGSLRTHLFRCCSLLPAHHIPWMSWQSLQHT